MNITKPGYRIGLFHFASNNDNCSLEMIAKKSCVRNCGENQTGAVSVHQERPWTDIFRKGAASTEFLISSHQEASRESKLF